LESKKH
jgi:hypothetical protein